MRGVVALRADASAAIGGGHVMRSLALADALALDGWCCVFLTGPETAAMVPELIASGHGRAAPAEASACDLLIVDHYGLDAGYERAARGWAKAVAVIDDLADRDHDCDWLIDVTLGRRMTDYAGRVPAAAQALFGPHYALLRPQFRHARAASLARRHGTVGRVLVNFGANDGKRLAAPALAALAAVMPGVAVDVILGALAPGRDEVRAAAATLPLAVNLHEHVADMAGLMSAADLCIGAGGGTSWERCCLGLPSVVVATADNQAGVVAALAQAGAIVSAGDWRQHDIAAGLDRVAEPATRAEMARRGALICDGLGAVRVALALGPERTRGNMEVTLRPVTAGDGELLLQWQSDPRTRRHFRQPRAPQRDDHFAWLDRKLADPLTLMAIIYHDGRPAGMVRVDPVAGGGEVSILVEPQSHGLGIGTAALRALSRLLRQETLVAEVLPGNSASASAFVSAGFQQMDGGHYLRAALDAAQTLPGHQDLR